MHSTSLLTQFFLGNAAYMTLPRQVSLLKATHKNASSSWTAPNFSFTLITAVKTHPIFTSLCHSLLFHLRG
ncbi:hypothetical protein BKA61DRAFT_587168 [Leptodontidium sp. MPI-SDFR-AT-0119]|nr:hypothetical protein BKA61DRAFT_587168 [Leptodontidium sp. MPI-SDFR-AT-0119]